MPAPPKAVQSPGRLALRPKEAAQALGIGERLLWSKTNAGEIPHVRVGKAILYPVAALEKWLLDQTREVKR
ncbi:MAG: helix-turn-helix domain-containing protein [Planctomycetota bacterium]|nr:helix-turn-helix domain-containing protein [Planctomycetota bacterium]